MSIRAFAIEGIVTAPVTAGARLSYDSVQLLKLPYLAGQVLTPDQVTPQTTNASMSANAATALVFVQADPGEAYYYEVTPGGRTAVLANSSSPILRGDQTLNFGPGWVISFLKV